MNTKKGRVPHTAAAVLYMGDGKDFHPTLAKSVDPLLNELVGGFRRRMIKIGKPFSTVFGADPVLYEFTGGRRVVAAPLNMDAAEGVMAVAALAARFDLESVVYGGTCGLLVDGPKIYDLFVPARMCRSDLEYAGPDGKVLFMPEWPADLRALFPFYELDLSRSPLRRRMVELGASSRWVEISRRVVASSLFSADTTASPKVFDNVVHVTGSQFVAGPEARERYRDYFKASTVDLRAQHVVMAGVRLGIPAAAVVCSANLAGADSNEAEAFAVAVRHIPVNQVLYSAFAIASAAGPL